MPQSSHLDLLDLWGTCASDAGKLTNESYRAAAEILRKIKARNDADDREVWDELRERLADLDHDVEWMIDYDPDDDPRERIR